MTRPVDPNDKNVYPLVPMLMRRKSDIADVFEVKMETVVKWAKEGAPIFLAGKRYCADYHAMVAWLTEHRKPFKVKM
jgi:Phage DNA packaging protein Nu1.